MNIIMMIIAAIFSFGTGDGATMDDCSTGVVYQGECQPTGGMTPDDLAPRDGTEPEGLPLPQAERGVQVVVEADTGVCYINGISGRGSTEYGFLPCSWDYAGELVVSTPEEGYVPYAYDDGVVYMTPESHAAVLAALDAEPIPVVEEVGVVPTPQQQMDTLPETGGEPFMLGIGVILVALGMGLRRIVA